ncbi:MAG TPA: bifunctional precorrin-2 dehydrogenase/sirohydrochlorin ferrochelatase [Nitrososphaerales archaeon]|nr:bifunctional precorrin-2 dehydrogenase/sirohydrochlorin ferrochelatase [Nitrososphaerales archaeon]
MVDLNIAGKDVLVIATSDEAETRALQLLSEGANVTVFTLDRPTKELQRAVRSGKIGLPNQDGNADWRRALRKGRPFLSVIATGNARTDKKIASYARRMSRLVYVVDRPSLNDLNMTGVAKIGDIRVAVSTGGVSPAMAGLLRRKIESLITKEDVLHVRLQTEVRGSVRRSIKDPALRKKAIYGIIRSQKVTSLLKSDRFDDAKRYAERIIAAARKTTLASSCE